MRVARRRRGDAAGRVEALDVERLGDLAGAAVARLLEEQPRNRARVGREGRLLCRDDVALIERLPLRRGRSSFAREVVAEDLRVAVVEVRLRSLPSGAPN